MTSISRSGWRRFGRSKSKKQTRRSALPKTVVVGTQLAHIERDFGVGLLIIKKLFDLGRSNLSGLFYFLVRVALGWRVT